MGEKEILEAAVLLRVGRQREDDPDGDLLLPRRTEARPAAFIRHIEALFYRPAQDKAHGGIGFRLNKPQNLSNCIISNV